MAGYKWLYICIVCSCLPLISFKSIRLGKAIIMTLYCWGFGNGSTTLSEGSLYAVLVTMVNCGLEAILTYCQKVNRSRTLHHMPTYILQLPSSYHSNISSSQIITRRWMIRYSERDYIQLNCYYCILLELFFQFCC